MSQQHEWISFSDRKPEEGQEIFASVDGKGSSRVNYYKERVGFKFWIPFPTLPKTHCEREWEAFHARKRDILAPPLEIWNAAWEAATKAAKEESK